jgi:hypothetical protein
LLYFLALLDDRRLFGMLLTEAKELAQLGTDNKETACQHRSGYLQEEQARAGIGIGISRFLECDRKSEKLGDGEQYKHGAGKMAHSFVTPLVNFSKAAPGEEPNCNFIYIHHSSTWMNTFMDY